MDQMQHQMMGYDRAITMFSPDGRLLQVEYAKRTVRLGNTAIGMVCKDGVLLVTDKRIVNPLVIPESIEKIFQIDDHVMCTAAGILSDARVLVERSQVKAQQHKIDYDSPIDNITIVKDICSLKQLCTQSGGLRPFGVSLLVAGIDDSKPSLFETDPTGLYYQYKAKIIGEGEAEGQKILEAEYKETMTCKEGLALAVKILKESLGADFTTKRIDAATISIENPVIKKVPREEIKKLK
ncbi:MAG: archaeal proteasome endopeptidase complex subunit alpha [Candidatus Woesearchaeota archaeon]